MRWSTLRLRVCGLTLFALAGPNALADSDLIFPRLSSGSDELTGLAVVNPNTQTATVTFTAYGEGGQPLQGGGIQNPVVVNVGAGQQFAQVAAVLFGDTGQGAAWIRATSPSNNLAGFFLFLNQAQTQFDGADLPEPAAAMVFNEVRLGGGYTTELNLVNPGSESAQVDISLIGSGAPLERELSIPAQGVRRLDVADFFEIGVAGAGEAAVRYIRVASSTPLAGFEFVRGPGDLLGVNARPADEVLETLLFPQLAVLGAVSSEVVVVNYSDQTVLVTLRAHKPDGSLYGTENLLNNPVTLSLSGGEALREDLAALFGFFGSQSLDGWLEVVSSSDAVNATLSYAIPAVNSLASVASTKEPTRQAVFSHIATSLGFFTGVALLNGSELTANVRVVALRPDGGRLGSYDMVLPPGQRISKLIEELIPQAAGQAGGFIWVSSDIPLFLTSLFGSISSGVLANIPPQPVPASFQPDAGSPQLSLQPLLAVLSPTSSQNFTVQGANPMSWSVNDVVGGNNLYGTVSATGSYTAPATIPEDLPVTITAASDGSTVGGSIDILAAELFVGTTGTPQSVAYLEAAQRVYYSELSFVASLSERVLPRGASTSRIVEVNGGQQTVVLDLPGDEVPKLVPYTAIDGKEYLLLAAKISGRVLRLNPRDRQVFEVATGLDLPTALAYDPVEKELLVAQEGGVVAIPAAQLDSGIGPALTSRTTALDRQVLPAGQSVLDNFLAAPRGRLAVNQCNGNLYLSLEEKGQILEYVRLTGALRVLAEGLSRPGNLLGLYRNGVGCPEAFHLLVPELGADRITLVAPELDLVVPWLNLAGVSDLTLVPPGGPVAPGGGVLFADSRAGAGEITLVRFPGLYRGRGLNSPRRGERNQCVLHQVTRTAVGNVHEARVVGDRVFFVSPADPTGGNPDGSDELFSVDQDGNVAQLTDLSQGGIRDLVVSADGAGAAFVSDGALTTPDPPGDNLFVFDTSSGEVAVVPVQPEGAPSIDGSGRYVAVASRSDPLDLNSDRNSEIFVVDTEAPTGQKLTQITRTTGRGSRAPSLNDDGTVLAFRSVADLTGENPDGDLVIFVYRRSDANTVQVALEERSPDEIPESPIPLSGDGTRLAFVSQENLTGQNPDGGRALFSADIAEGTLRQVFRTGRAMILTDLSRDGEFAAVATSADPKDLNRDRNTEIFLIDLDGGSVVQLTRSIDAVNLQADLSPEDFSVSVLSNADYLGLNRDRNFEAFLFICRRP